MDIFIHNVPHSANSSNLEACIKPYLLSIGLDDYELAKVKNKPFATLYVKDAVLAQHFITHFDKKIRLPRTRAPLGIKRAKDQDGGASVRRNKIQNEIDESLSFDMARSTLEPKAPFRMPVSNPVDLPAVKGSAFEFGSASCGYFAYDMNGLHPVFVPRSRLGSGRLILGNKACSLLIDHEHRPSEWFQRVDANFEEVDLITVSNKYGSATVNLSLKIAPRMYRRAEESPTPFEYLLTLSEQKKLAILRRTRTRLPSLNEVHKTVAGTCFVYQLTLLHSRELETLATKLKSLKEAPSFASTWLPTLTLNENPVQEMQNLHWTIHSMTTANELPFAVGFEALKLAMNGKLRPRQVRALLPELCARTREYNRERVVAALRHIYSSLAMSGPHTPGEELTVEGLTSALSTFLRQRSSDYGSFAIASKNAHLAIVYRARVTPAGVYLEGPEAEVSNRVLRRYEDHIDSFLRVTFSDEDGKRLESGLNTKLSEVYVHFQNILDQGIEIGYRRYQFLGFSGSSLRSQTCWFMAPFAFNGRLLSAEIVIEELGDFTTFRSPAKCAARIGQAFTDTTSFVTVSAGAIIRKRDVERNGRVFSDGCGTISRTILDRVRQNYPKLLLKMPPVALQIRFQGAKGMASLDPDLPQETICIRPSMHKFDSRGTLDIEVCGVADRPLPLYLNRPLVKVLEDLGVKLDAFLALQGAAISELESITSSAINASNFLAVEQIASHVGIPSLMMHINDIRLDPQQDDFLRSVVEMAALYKLRDIKYRCRIKIKHAVKLYGVMDETGFLQEGEVYCSINDSEGGHRRLQGRLMITRSPTMHPGDVQIVQAVPVPSHSNLNHLYNVVVFSQHGTRDLASQLGGGDLDGDHFDVVWDPLLIPSTTRTPADYPRQAPIDIGRQIVLRDMTKHFIQFMENDRVGQISSLHLQLSDRLKEGTIALPCIKLAEMASIAVDYSKTGIPVNMDDRPRFDTSEKPDFMAPSPRIHVHQKMKIGLEGERNLEAQALDAYKALNQDDWTIQYYKSNNILGKLFRQIDERQFLARIVKQEAAKNSNNSGNVMASVLDYVLYAAKGITWKPELPVARDIRDTYELAIEQVRWEYALRQADALHEIEVVAGIILGYGNKRVRELSKEMSNRFGRDVAYVKDLIRGSNDQNHDDDGHGALATSIACFYLAMKEPGNSLSFKHLAASFCLREIAILHGGILKTYGGAWKQGGGRQ